MTTVILADVVCMRVMDRKYISLTGYMLLYGGMNLGGLLFAHN